MGSFQPLAIKLSFTGRGTALFRPRERPREGIPVNGPVNDPVGGLLSAYPSLWVANIEGL